MARVVVVLKEIGPDASARQSVGGESVRSGAMEYDNPRQTRPDPAI